MKWRVVIFDSDGMLLHGPRFSEAYAREHGVPLEEISPFFTGPFKDCLVGKADLKEELQKGWLQKWGWQDSVDAFLAYWFSIGDRLDEEVFSTISLLKEKGIICVLTTNQEKYRTEHVSKEFGYHQAFDKIFSSAYVGHKKPSEEFFADVFSDFQTKDPALVKEEVLFWDDDQENIDGANEFGFDTELFIDAVLYKEKLKDYLAG